MRRGMLLLVCVGLLGALSGCRSSQSSCGCQTAPAGGHLSPSPIGGSGAPIGSFSSGPAASTLAPPLGR